VRPSAGALREGSVQRFDSEDLRKLASASKKVLKVVARETARELVDRRRERRGRPPSGVPEPVSAPPRRRRRFKRRWVVVPVMATVVFVLLLLVGAGIALAWWLGLL
jgi:hypothetical protein